MTTRALCLLLLGLLLVSDRAVAAGLSPGVHRRLSDIREQMDAGRQRQSLPRLRRLLQEVRGDSYAEAVLHQHLGHAHLALEQQADAHRELSAALKSATLPGKVERQLRSLLAQLALRLDKPEEALAHLQIWLKETEAPTPDERAMAAQIQYAAGQPGQAIRQMEQAIAAKRPVPESWRRSLLGMYLEARRHKQARRLLKRLIRDKPAQAEYWRHLTQLELHLGRQQRALEVMALAYAQGLLELGELTRFASLHASVGLPEKAARLLKQWRDTKRLPVTRKRLRAEAELWLKGREREPALALFELAAHLADNGRDDFQRGRILFDSGRWQESIQSLQHALRRGGLREPERAWLLLGIAAVQAGDRQLARSALKQAMQSEKTRGQAESWLAAVKIADA